MDTEGTPFGRYRLIALLGRGGMGEVWRAYDTDTDRVVALKLLPGHFSEDEDFQRRFGREAHAAARLNDPHVIPIHHYGEIDGRLYVDMRLIEGRDLATVLAEGPLEPARAVRIIEQVAKALHAAHKIGLVHRDVKPSNILLDDDDFAYLIDFGLARAAGETRLTSTGGVIGSWHYMSPERLRAGEVDARADIYALACVLYECLTGSTPYPGDTLEQQMSAHLWEPPPRPSATRPDVPARVDEVIATGMAKDPDQRYATTVELANAARDAITVPIPRSAPLPIPPSSQNRRSPKRRATPPQSHLGPQPIPAHRQEALTQPHDDQPSTQRPPYAPPRLPSAAQQLTTSKRPSRGTKIALAVCAAVILAIAAVVAGTVALTRGHNTSAGPEQRDVPDVSSMSYADAVTTLRAAGFSKFKQAKSPSTPEMLGKVIGTNPPANQISAINNVITIVIGSGPENKQIPDVAGQTVDVAQKNLTVYGFTNITQTQVDSPRPAGEVIGTNPPKGQTVPLDSVIELQVSKGNQFVMPDLSGMLWTDAEPRLRALGWTGVLDKAPDVDAGGSLHNKVVRQSPAPGTGVNSDGLITLSFGQ